ncbi:hypothetical protein ACS0TY_001446 [Phlomoides rotata]
MASEMKNGNETEPSVTPRETPSLPLLPSPPPPQPSLFPQPPPISPPPPPSAISPPLSRNRTSAPPPTRSSYPPIAPPPPNPSPTFQTTITVVHPTMVVLIAIRMVLFRGH